jgi:hypothetical protein
MRAPAHHLAARSRAPLALTATLLACAFPSSAGAQTTFGADLGQAPDVTFGCEIQPFESPVLTKATSCTWTTAATSEARSSQALQPPEGKGMISQVSLRVGPHTGLMKVVIMRVLLEFVDIGSESVHAEISCCADVAESEPFTPNANAVTTIPVSLPVEVEGSVTPGLKVDDLVGLSVLESGVPIPAVEEKASFLDEPSDYDEFPAMQLGGIQLAGDPRGYQLLMDATWDQAASSPPPSTTTSTPTPTPAPAQVPKPPQTSLLPTLSFPAGTLARIMGANALVHLSCGAAAACDGTVRLQSAPAGHAGAVGTVARKGGKKKKNKAPVVTYASGSFSLAAGKSQAVSAKLSGSGKTFARRHKRVKVWINVTLTNTTPAKVSSHAVTLTF